MMLYESKTALELLRSDVEQSSIYNARHGNDTATTVMRVHFPRLRGAFGAQIRYLSPDFLALYKARTDRSDYLRVQPLLESQARLCGTFIVPVDTGLQTIFYYIDGQGGSVYGMEATAFIFDNGRNKDLPTLLHAGYFCSTDSNEVFFSPDRLKTWLVCSEFLEDIFNLLGFLQQTNPKTTAVGAGRRLRHNGIEYHNRTAFSIEIVDVPLSRDQPSN
jgi:hypothetical protein